jgi:hypothetical protein
MLQLNIIMYFSNIDPLMLAKLSGIKKIRLKRIFKTNDLTFGEAAMILRGLKMSFDEFISYSPQIND